MNNIPNYEMIRVIGSGCFGYVFEVRNKKTKQRAALKRIQKVSNMLSRQYQILFMVQDCQNVVKVLDFFYSKNEQDKLIQNIVFEYVEDNLESLIVRTNKQGKNISELTIKNYMYQLLNGLKNLHRKNIAHRDLKPENVLLSKNGEIKICDFGSSKIINESGKNTPFIVSRYYRAPELNLCVTRYNVLVDIWSAACIMAQLFLLTPLFKGKNEGDQIFAIFKVLGSLSEVEKKQYEIRVPFNVHLIRNFMPFERVDLNELFCMVQDRENFLDLLLKMFAYLPENRMTAEQAVSHPFFDDVRPTHKNTPAQKMQINKTVKKMEEHLSAQHEKNSPQQKLKPVSEFKLQLKQEIDGGIQYYDLEIDEDKNCPIETQQHQLDQVEKILDNAEQRIQNNCC